MSIKSKDGIVTNQEKGNAKIKASSILENIKENAGKVVLIRIDANTTLEFSAQLSDEELNIRIENYKKRRNARNAK